MVVRFRTGTPSRRARSVFSAAARMAVPARDRRRNQASAPTTTGTTATASRWLPVMSAGPTSNDSELSGVSNAPSTRPSAPNSFWGMSSSIPPRTWARPMVATVSTSRGASANRRTTADLDQRADPQAQRGAPSTSVTA